MKNIPVRSIQTVQHNAGSFSSFRIRTLTEVLNGNDLVQDLHRHDFFFVLVINKGRGEHEIDFNKYRISDNSVFIMRPGQVHRLVIKAGSQGYLMEFAREFGRSDDLTFYNLLRNVSNKNQCAIDRRGSEGVLQIVTSIHEEYLGRREEYQEVIRANLRIFLIEILRQRKGGGRLSTGKGDYKQERLDEFQNLLEERINSSKQVSYYADLMNLSVFQLNSITRGLLGKSVADVINDFIVLESKRHLLGTSGQVNQIAYQLGYDDVSYFIRFFKKHTGHTPEEFRQKFG